MTTPMQALLSSQHMPFALALLAFFVAYFYCLVVQVDQAHDRRVKSAKKRRVRRKTRNQSPKRVYNLRSSGSPRYMDEQASVTPPPLADFSSSDDDENASQQYCDEEENQNDEQCGDQYEVMHVEELPSSPEYWDDEETSSEIVRLKNFLENGLLYPVSPLQTRQMVAAYELILPHMAEQRPSIKTIVKTLADKLKVCPSIEFKLPQREAIRTSPYQAPLYDSDERHIERLFDEHAAGRIPLAQ